MSAHSLHYVGNIPRSNPEMHWRVDSTWTVNGRPGISFFYFRDLDSVVNTYPDLRDDAIRFHLDHIQRELNTYAAPGCDDPYTIRLLNTRLNTCRDLLESNEP